MSRKKIMGMILAILVFSSVVVFAQSMKGWVWRNYNLKFSIPSNLKMTKADAKVFAASDGSIFSMNIVPWKDASATAAGIANSYYNGYKVANKQILSRGSVRMQFKDFQGYLIVGKGVSSGKNLYFAIFGAIDKRSSVNFMSSFAWWSNPSYDQYYASLCDKIAASFKKM